MLYATGISQAGEVIDLGMKYGLVIKSGAWLTLAEPKKLGADSDKLGQGRESARAYLEKDPKLLEKLVDEIKERSQEEAKEES